MKIKEAQYLLALITLDHEWIIMLHPTNTTTK